MKSHNRPSRRRIPPVHRAANVVPLRRRARHARVHVVVASGPWSSGATQAGPWTVDVGAAPPVQLAPDQSVRVSALPPVSLAGAPLVTIERSARWSSSAAT